MWKSPACQARYEKYCRVVSSLQHPFLLLIRLYWGWSFFEAGWGKFGNMAKVIGTFTEMHIPVPIFNAYLVATTETVGGLCLLLGLFSRVATIPLMITMIVALCTAHAEATFNLFHDPETFLKQAPILYLYTILVVWIFGPGKWSLANCCCKKSCRHGSEL